MNQLQSYHKKSDEELQYIIKDAAEAAIAMRGLDLGAEMKYLDQVNDACTVLYSRKGQDLLELADSVDFS